MIIKPWALRIGVALLATLCVGCATAAVIDVATDDTRRIASGTFSSPAWVNETFTGMHARELNANQLTFSLEQTVHGGGWDTAVALASDQKVAVSDVDKPMVICFRYDLDLTATESGKWWAGPKISVNWEAMTDAPSTGQWYENYVVEMANQTPAELEADLFDYFDPVFLGESEIEGATYRHLKLQYQDWWQYWSIRQDYRASGKIEIGEILQAWADIPQDLNFDGVKANIETHGPVAGTGIISAGFTAHSLPSSVQANCK